MTDFSVLNLGNSKDILIFISLFHVVLLTLAFYFFILYNK